MAETDLKVQIRFEATGDKELAKAFTAAANAQKKLDDTTKKLAAAQRQLGKRTGFLNTNFTRLTKTAGGLRFNLATLRSQLLIVAFGFNFLDRTIGKGIRAFVTQQQAIAKLNSTLISTGNSAQVSSRELQGLATRLQKLTGIGDETILSMQGVLLTFTQIKGQVFKDATKAILNISVALGQDLQQTAIQVGKALNDPILGVSALSRVGIQFTDRQKAMIKQLAKTNQVAKAQGIILKELELQFGGTAEGIDGTALAINRLSSAFGDLVESGGGFLAPLLEKILNLSTKVIENLNDTPDVKFNEFLAELDNSSKQAIATFKLLSQTTGDLPVDVIEKPFEAIDKLRQQIRELQTEVPEFTFFDDIVSMFGEGQDIEGILKERGFFGVEGLSPKNLTKGIEKFLKDAKAPAVTEMRKALQEIIKDGVLTKEEFESAFTTDFNDRIKSVKDIFLQAIQMNMQTKGLVGISPFADIMQQIFGGEILFSEQDAAIQKLQELIKAIQEYAIEAGKSEEKSLSFLERMSEFKKENEDAIKGFDDMANSLMAFTKNNKEMTISLLKLRRALAIGNTILAFTEFLSQRMYGKAFSALAAGMQQVAQIKSQLDAAREAAVGADFITQGRQMLVVGDNATGRERVQVTPLGNGGGTDAKNSSVTINLNGNILGTDEFVRDTLIPQIENAMGRNLA